MVTRMFGACVIACLISLPAHSAERMQGMMVSDGVTGGTSTPHGWMEQNVYARTISHATACGAQTNHTPPGWFQVQGELPPGEAVVYTARYDGIPAFDYRTGVRIADGTSAVEGVNFHTTAHYSVMYNRGPDDWGDSPWLKGTDFYQTFIARGPHVTRFATKLADKTPAYTAIHLNYAIYSTTDGPPSEWERISPIRSQYLSPTTDPIIHIFWVPYLSKEVTLTPGKRYAFRLWRDEKSQSEEFALVARRDDGTGYPDGLLYSGDEPLEGWDAYGYVSGGAVDTVVNHAPLDFNPRDLMGWNTRFGQTFVATGTGLIAVDFVYATGEASPVRPATFQLYDGVGGKPIGPARGVVGIPHSFQGRGAAFWQPGEVPLEPGKTYYIEGTSNEGTNPGFNVWKMNDDIPGVEAYLNGESKAPADLMMEIVELK